MEQEAWKVSECPSFTPRLTFFQAEQTSVSALLALLTRAIEALSFVLLLNDYHLGDLYAQYVFSW